MKKLDFGQAVGLFANLGVIAGIIFLGFELQQNQRGIQAQTRATLAQIDIESIRGNRQDSALMELIIADRPELESVDQYRFELYVRELARTAEHHYYQHRLGTFDESEFEGVRVLWKRLFSIPSQRAWWEEHKAEFSTAFQEEFEALLDEQ